MRRAAATSLAKRRARNATAATNATAAALQQEPVSIFVHMALPRGQVRPLGTAALSSSSSAAAGAATAGGKQPAAVALLPHKSGGGYGGQPLHAFTASSTAPMCPEAPPSEAGDEECVPPAKPAVKRDCSHVEGDAVGSKLCEAAHGDVEGAAWASPARTAFGKAVSAAATWPFPGPAADTTQAHATCWASQRGRHWDMHALHGKLAEARQGAVQAVRSALAGRKRRGPPPSLLPLLNGDSCTSNAQKNKQNVVVLQVVLQPPATLDVVFLPEAVLSNSSVLGGWAAGELVSQQDLAAAIQEQGMLAGDAVQPAIHAAVDAFEERLSQRLHLAPAKVQREPHADVEDVSWAALATRFALSNMVGCITRFRGSMLVATDVGGFESESHQAAPNAPSAPHTLFSGMPSRTLFPRGFLWDEGFHQLLVMKWRPQLSMQVIQSWFDTQQADALPGTLEHGWIAREQILGSEALTRVAERFAVQRPDIANPPTMLLSLQQLLQTTSAQEVTPWLKKLYPALQRWYAWFLRTQRTDTDVKELNQPWMGKGDPPLHWLQARKALRGDEPELFLEGKLAAGGWDGYDQRGFQWQGSSPDHTFACGLDDSPRGVVPSAKDQHLDLLAWMLFAARTLRQVAQLAGMDSHQQLFAADERKFQGWMDRHWSSGANGGAGWFCDVGAEAIFPELRHPRTQQVAPHEISVERAKKDLMVRHFMRSQQLNTAQANALAKNARIGHVCHRSYLALFPLLLTSLPAGDKRLLPLIRAVTQSDMLGPGGVKSLSSDSPLFGSKDDYWRGKAWMNINFLLVQGLEHYAKAPLQQTEGTRSKATAAESSAWTGIPAVDSVLSWATGASSSDETAPMTAEEWAQAQSEAAAAAQRIRDTIVQNMVHKYETQGSLFENYEAQHGAGTGTAPFTGWTGAVLPLLRSASSSQPASHAVQADGSIS